MASTKASCGQQPLPAGQSAMRSWRLHASTSRGCRHKQRVPGMRAVRSPCVVITAPDDIHNPSLQHLAQEVRQQLGLQAVVIAPAAALDQQPNSQLSESHINTAQGKNHTSTASFPTTAATSGCTATAAPPPPASAAASLSFEQQLPLLPHPTHELTYSLPGATAADCMLCAVDQACGLLQALSLSPVLVLVGVSRGPALSSDMDTNPAVAVARQAALLGLPAVAACLATTTASVPMQPAVVATVQLLAKLLPVLQNSSNNSRSSSSSRGWGMTASARNFPRAHFPFPEEGRWALGTQMPLPYSAAEQQPGSAFGSSSSSRDDSKYDCWALGEDNSWLGEYNSSRKRVSTPPQAGAALGRAAAQQRAYQVLQGAFADGDVLMCLNVPPTWREGSGFAATRPGVLWHCWQVDAYGQQQQQGQQCGQVDANSNSTSSGSSSSYRSWQVDGEDLFGRSLPSSSYSSQVPAGRNFVGQDNTRKVSAEGRFAAWYSSGGQLETQQPESEEPKPQQQHGDLRGGGYSQLQGQASNPRQERDRTELRQSSAAAASAGVGAKPSSATHGVPCSFVVQRGTLLSDAAACGDVEAVFSGRVAVTVCQTWPSGHPLSVRDELLMAALDTGPGGWPAWLEATLLTQ